MGVGNRMDLLFHNIRLGLFYTDHKLITENMDKANVMLEQGGDWDRRNRLKVYQVTEENTLDGISVFMK